MDEREAVARLKRGDIAGLEALVRRYQVQAVRAAYLITRDRGLAEELVQEAFLRAYERITQFDETQSFGPWFLRIVVNDAVKTAARHRRHVPLEMGDDDNAPIPGHVLADPGLTPDELAERAEVRERIWQALAQLSPAQRAAIVLRYYLGLSERSRRQARTRKWPVPQAGSR